MDFVRDSFTDLNGTLLSAHTGEVGAAWTLHPSSGGNEAPIANGRLRCPSTAVVPLYTASGLPTSPDYIVEADFTYLSLVAGAFPSVMLRTDPVAFTGVIFGWNDDDDTWYVFDVLSPGGVNTRGTFVQALTIGNTYHAKLVLRGTNAELFIDGVSRITTSAILPAAAGRVGLRMFSNNTANADTTGVHIDNLLASYVASAPVLGDRVWETTTTTGTGPLALAGAVSGYRAFSAIPGIATGDPVLYTISNASGFEWEVGIGTWSTGVLTRDRVFASSNAGALVNFSAGTKDVFDDLPALQVLAPFVTGEVGATTYLPQNTVLYVPEDYEVPSGIDVEIGTDATLEG